MKIAISKNAEKLINFKIEREIVNIEDANFIEICSSIITEKDKEMIKKIKDTKFKIPIILITDKKNISEDLVNLVDKIIGIEEGNKDIHAKQVEICSSKYEKDIESPFFKLVKEYVKLGKNQFNCPGHHGGMFFEKHPSGKAFINFFGKNIFKADLCIADEELGDLLINEGQPCV